MPGEGIKIGKAEVNAVYEEQKYLNEILQGRTPAFISRTPNEQDIKATDKKFKKKVKNKQQQAQAAYEFAAMRDAYYCVAGRKYMRRLAVGGKIYSLLQRGIVLGQLEEEEKKAK